MLPGLTLGRSLGRLPYVSSGPAVGRDGLCSYSSHGARLEDQARGLSQIWFRVVRLLAVTASGARITSWRVQSPVSSLHPLQQGEPGCEQEPGSTDAGRGETRPVPDPAV